MELRECPVDGKCSTEGCDGTLIMAVDNTSYFTVQSSEERNGGPCYTLKHDHDEDSEEDARVFCDHCGQDYQPPEDYDTIPW